LPNDPVSTKAGQLHKSRDLMGKHVRDEDDARMTDRQSPFMRPDAPCLMEKEIIAPVARQQSKITPSREEELEWIGLLFLPLGMCIGHLMSIRAERFRKANRDIFIEIEARHHPNVLARSRALKRSR
jgi:hypothetical protein